ncbi:uncharacterized protein LAESUDRAFT_815304 [Laetiporus sulphureus 93-53]|uniref:KN homeodomain domain-containing protein n=1 Tax=Laetiporus sulphureus 93-53 TaxID=1314785 RepID=A0A165CA47_9APHY|nr:uncharacterized protein LAESUDRAFT_815304 [Laetiporus sulphureus 93-53]KZT02452.1 hypothetical protein LAESUDRAFT_815304 [Laetiporus sulphureus 93-53]
MIMADSIRSRLLDAEDKLLSTVIDGPAAIEAFDHYWTALLHDVDNALLSEAGLDADTISLAHATSSRIAILADTFQSMQADYDALTSAMVDDLEDALRRTTLQDIAFRIATPEEPGGNDAFLAGSSTTASFHRLENAASQWLFTNVNNPYPSRQMKLLIAKTAEVSLEVVDGWFKRTRRRIGWTTICAGHFHGSRLALINAVTRVLNDQDVEFLDPSTVLEIIEMHERAFKLANASANHINTWRHDITLDHSLKSSIPRTQRCAYASPCMSRPLPSDPSSAVYNSSLTPAVTRKRAASTLSEDIDTNTHCTTPPLKRIRMSYSLHDSSELDLPIAGSFGSPVSACAPSATDLIPHIETPTSFSHGSELALQSSSSSTTTNRRKRCAEEDNVHISKRSRCCAPDSVARMTSIFPPSDQQLDEEICNINDWFDSNFKNPDQVLLAPRDPSIPLDVTFFEDWASHTYLSSQSEDGIILGDFSSYDASESVSPYVFIPPYGFLADAPTPFTNDCNADHGEQLEMHSRSRSYTSPSPRLAPVLTNAGQSESGDESAQNVADSPATSVSKKSAHTASTWDLIGMLCRGLELSSSTDCFPPFLDWHDTHSYDNIVGVCASSDEVCSESRTTPLPTYSNLYPCPVFAPAVFG